LGEITDFVAINSSVIESGGEIKFMGVKNGGVHEIETQTEDSGRLQHSVFHPRGGTDRERVLGNGSNKRQLRKQKRDPDNLTPVTPRSISTRLGMTRKGETGRQIDVYNRKTEERQKVCREREREHEDRRKTATESGHIITVRETEEKREIT
jgi:hypothetical protein